MKKGLSMRERFMRPIMVLATILMAGAIFVGVSGPASAGPCPSSAPGSGCTAVGGGGSTGGGGSGVGGGSGGSGGGGGGSVVWTPPITWTSYYSSQGSNRGSLYRPIPNPTYSGSQDNPTTLYNKCASSSYTYNIAGRSVTQRSTGVTYVYGESYTYLGSTLVARGTEEFFQNCVYPAAPVYGSNTCAYSAGPGSLTGPWGTGLPVVLGNGTVDPRTESKTWTAPVEYSSLGNSYNSGGSTLGLSNNAYINAVLGCSNINYTFSVSNSACTLATGQSVVNSSTCQLIPGNYTTAATSKQITCGYIYYPTFRTFTALSCGSPYACTASGCSYNSVDALYCNSPLHHGADYTYNFATCGNTVATPACTWSNGTGNASLTDPYGVGQASGVQVTADGKAWKLGLASLSCAGTIQNQAEKIIVSKGSEPLRSGSAAASNQPVFGSFSPTATTGSILNLLSESAAGTSGWSNSSVYLRFYQPTTTATVSTPVGVGEVSNPVTANPGSAIPFGVYNVYTFTVPTTVNVGGFGGGATVINVPVTIAAPQTIFYPISGRVTG